MIGRSILGRVVAGGPILFRISNPGIEVTSAPDETRFAIYEGTRPTPPEQSGQIIMNANTEHVVFHPAIRGGPPYPVFFAHKTDASGSYIPSGGYLHCHFGTSQVYDRMTFVNPNNFQIELTYFIYNREIGA